MSLSGFNLSWGASTPPRSGPSRHGTSRPCRRSRLWVLPMSLHDALLAGGGGLVVLLTLVQLAPVRWDPWTAIGRAVGRAINGEVLARVDKLERDLNALRAAAEEREAISCRARILHFGDETLHGMRHTREHFDQVLRDLDSYEHYCDGHPDFENNVTVLTSSRIKDIYKKCLENNDFL